MSKLPAVTGRQAIRAFGRGGFVEQRVSGSHHILKKEGYRYLLTVPNHGAKELKAGTLRRLIRDAGLSVQEFIQLLTGCEDPDPDPTPDESSD